MYADILADTELYILSLGFSFKELSPEPSTVLNIMHSIKSAELVYLASMMTMTIMRMTMTRVRFVFMRLPFIELAVTGTVPGTM